MKHPLVLQHSEEDCGAACLSTVAQVHGRNLSLGTTRNAVGTSSFGTTLLGLRRGAEAIGLNARQVKASQTLIDRLDEAPLPAIIHWKGRHWIVLYGRQGEKFIVGDPAVGVRRLSRSELLEGWPSGIMLLLEPDQARFYEQPDEKPAGLLYFFKRAVRDRALIAQVTAMNMVLGVLALAFPITTQLLTDDVLVRKDVQLLTVVAVAVLALNLFQTAMRLVQSMLVGHFGQRLQLSLALEFGYKLLRLPMSYFDLHRSGEVVSRLSDMSRINTLLAEIVFGLPSQLFVALVSLSVMTWYSWKLTVAALGAFALVVLINLLFIPPLRQKIGNLIVQGTENQGFLVETFRGALVLKTHQATPQAWEECQSNFAQLANLRWGAMKLAVYRDTVTGLVSSLTALLILWFGSYGVIGGSMSIGQLIAFYGMSLNFLAFLGTVVRLSDDLVSAQVVMARLAAVLEAPAEDLDDPKRPWVEIPSDADIDCTGLGFHHVGRVELLQDFSYRFEGGKVTALIGPSGCGKSTLTKLLSGLYPLQAGNIRYGPFNQQDMPLSCLRQQVVLVPQEPQFWSRSILDNFRFSYPAVEFARIVEACQLTGADRFISEMPDKYQTVLGEFGINLSGGQRQRLALARALVIDPPVLIMDESTDSLDPPSEAEVLDRVLARRRGKTTILISHRPSVVSRADNLVMLDEGRIVFQDTVDNARRRSGPQRAFLGRRPDRG